MQQTILPRVLGALTLVVLFGPLGGWLTTAIRMAPPASSNPVDESAHPHPPTLLDDHRHQNAARAIATTPPGAQSGLGRQIKDRTPASDFGPNRPPSLARFGTTSATPVAAVTSMAADLTDRLAVLGTEAQTLPIETSLNFSESDSHLPMRGPFTQVNAAISPVEITSPGAILHVIGQPVVVEAYQPMSGGTGPALSVVVSDPASSTSPVFPDPAEAHVRNFGFTREEQLFRTRWGWAAYEATRRAVLAEDSVR